MLNKFELLNIFRAVNFSRLLFQQPMASIPVNWIIMEAYTSNNILSTHVTLANLHKLRLSSDETGNKFPF
jgi:hypothetical protein